MFSQQRLWLGGSLKRPSSIWASRINLYNDFKNAGNYENDSIHADLVTNDVIVNIVENRGIHILTSGSEWTASESGLTPSNFSVVKNTQNGSLKTLTPVVISGMVLFIERNGKSLLSYVYDYNQSAYTSDNLSLLSNLIQSPVGLDVENNASRDKGDFIYMVLEDGTMLSCCIVISQQINSITLFETEGNIKDVCTLIDETYILVERNNIYYVEKMADYFTDSTKEVIVSDLTMGGLDDYEGKEVIVYDKNKRIYGQDVVEGGNVNLDKTTTQKVFVGLPFDYQITSNPIVISGKSFSVKKRIAQSLVYTQDTDKLTFNGQTKVTKDGIFNFYGVTDYGEKVDFTIKGSFDPIHIVSITLNINFGN